MLTRLHRWVSRRPAPVAPGRPASRRDGPPDGWEVLNAGAAERLTVGLDRALLNVTGSAERGIGRREFLKRAGQVGLLAGLSVTGLLWRPERARGYAQIFNTCDPFGDPPAGPCGPSGLCGADNCNNGQCANANRKRRYAGGTCCSGCTGTDNCWRENCCNNNQWNSLIKCCDCCVNAGQPGTTCTDCIGVARRRCNCRAKVGSPC